MRHHEKELREKVESLRDQCQRLSDHLGSLGKEKEKLESILNVDKIQLQSILAQALTALKQQRPDLFMLSEQEKMALLVGLFLKRMIS